jgi:mono/diheme cytochrome c family protein
VKRFIPLLATAALLLSACGNNMHDQPVLKPFQPSPFFEDGMGMRPPVEGTVARRTGDIDPVFFTGMGPMGPVTELPIELTVELLQRGQERYDIFCSVCHGYTGHGNGMIVSRGFPAPASFHEPRLLSSSVGYTFVAITNGFGRMYSYASRIPPEDRWAIAAYIKALQLSQNAALEDLPLDVRLELLQTEGQAR